MGVLVFSSLAVVYIAQPPAFGSITSALDVYVIVLNVDQLVRWLGSVTWAWVSAGRLDALFAAWRDYERLFGAEPLPKTCRYLGCFVAYQVISFVYVGAVTVAASVEKGVDWRLAAVRVASPTAAYGGFVFWLILFASMCRGLAEVFGLITERLREAAERGDLHHLRRLAHQHSRVAALADELCRTFGGFVAVGMYMLILEVSLSVYFGMRPGQEAGGSGSPALRALQRLLTPSSLILLKLMTNAGHGCQRESRRAAEEMHQKLRNRLAGDGGESAAVRAELLEIYTQLEGQAVNMDMAGYFTLDRQFFVQSIKDFLTLIIAAVQFDMPFLLKQ